MHNRVSRFVSLLPAFAAFACGGTAQRTTGAAHVPPLVASVAPVEAAPIASVADPSFPSLYAQTSGFRAGRPAAVTVSPDGQRVFFLRSGARNSQRDLFALNVENGEENTVLTADSILQGAQERLSAEERALRERLRMTASGIASYELSPDGAQVLVPLSGGLYLVTLEGGEVRELPNEGGYANDPRFSPNGRFVSCVRGGDLYVIDVQANRQRRLTRTAQANLVNGLAEFVAQEEMSRYHGYWWSPDSRQILYQETNTEEVETLYASNPIDPAAAPHGSPYPRAGTRNATIRLGVIGVGGGRTRWVEWDRERYPYLTTVKWRSETPLALVVQDRIQQNAAVLMVNPQSGATTVLHEEHDDAWLNIDQSVPRFIDGERFLWSTERGGSWQLEVRGGTDGARTLTTAALAYESVLRVEGDAIWISSAPMPGENRIVRIALDGDTEPAVLTRGEGEHSATFGQDELWVHEFHPNDGDSSWSVLRGSERVGSLRSAAEPLPFETSVEFREVGPDRLRAGVVRPRNFVAGRNYPVLVSVYGGPGYVKVRRQTSRWVREQWQADHGFIVVSIDGHGTPGRGREWERAIRNNVIDGPLADQITGLRGLAAEIPEMDLERVGIYGWSFGGYFTAMAVSRHPEIFKVGVAGAPVCDWRDYDTHYTERFMGLVSENEAGYDRTSVLTYAPNLRRPLMIIHGTSDDNVYFAHALKMSDSLLRAGAAHEFVVLAGSTHMVADPAVASALQSRIMQFLANGLRPEN